ncbi:MAG: amino-acid racemase [Pseudonocardiales bacterium]|nr:amino-acid racemase [Pseudonocardiales bacterium]
MNRVGLLGGMSWESTAVYYRLLNEAVHERVGGHASAPLVVWSVDFAEIEALQQAGDWAEQGRILGEAAAALQRAGVDAIALATNTLHLVADDITARIDVPFIDLIDVVGAATEAAGHQRVGILATGYTMDSDLYPSRLAKFGAEVLVPDVDDRAEVHRVIFEELVHGVVRDESRAAYLAVIDRLVERGADAVILACTEIGLLVRDGDAAVPLLDTTALHCAALTDVMINGVKR